MRAALPIVLLAACASEQPAGTSGFDDSAGVVEVAVAGDDFVLCGGERLPLDAFVLRLRQRTRAMTRDQLNRFVVHIRMAADIPAGEPAKVAYANKNRLLDELHVMGVTQVRYL
ncbi:MAG: hypothetical protein WAT39_05630 [Planctomycetota bacterium]